ncbi:unnamed protein product [Dibothriocephalus latus]|uniref:Uncharacterized protein n=1 Tax=Dibothriocephalus latus TaxID=60516 RepID=A0A3P7LGA2_DIBLA|nr:unnamed protein product [Dibothriocephalus latus]
MLLRYKPVRTFFKFPEVVPPPKTKVKKAGFVAGFRESMHNSKLLAELEARERADAERWQKAGLGTAPKTYAHDPTRLSARKRVPLINVKGVVSSPPAAAKMVK